MSDYHESIQVTSQGSEPTFINITDEVKRCIAASKISQGIVAITSPHTTCAIYFDEFAHDLKENGTDYLQDDLNRCLSKIVPNQKDFPPDDGYQYPGEEHYRAVESWPNADQYVPGGDRSQLLNADAHIKASILGSSEICSIVDSQLAFGVTGYLFFVDFDRTRSRQRTCHITVIGE